MLLKYVSSYNWRMTDTGGHHHGDWDEEFVVKAYVDNFIASLVTWNYHKSMKY